MGTDTSCRQLIFSHQSTLSDVSLALARVAWNIHRGVKLSRCDILKRLGKKGTRSCLFARASLRHTAWASCVLRALSFEVIHCYLEVDVPVGVMSV